jgi:hypothetical protein
MIKFGEFKRIYDQYIHWQEFLYSGRHSFTEKEIAIIELFNAFGTVKLATTRLNLTGKEINQALSKLKESLPLYEHWFRETRMVRSTNFSGTSYSTLHKSSPTPQ